jgi:hypothetical protein
VAVLTLCEAGRDRCTASIPLAALLCRSVWLLGSPCLPSVNGPSVVHAVTVVMLMCLLLQVLLAAAQNPLLGEHHFAKALLPRLCSIILSAHKATRHVGPLPSQALWSWSRTAHA